MTVKGMTLDEALQPMKMTCGKCQGELTVYPAPIPKGMGFCPTCSPAWLESFAIHCMNVERTKQGFMPIKSAHKT